MVDSALVSVVLMVLEAATEAAVTMAPQENTIVTGIGAAAPHAGVFTGGKGAYLLWIRFGCVEVFRVGGSSGVDGGVFRNLN